MICRQQKKCDIELSNFKYLPFENKVEIENAGKQDFLLFPQCFLAHQKKLHPLKPVKIIVCILFQLGQG